MIDVLKDVELLLPWEKCSERLENELSREVSEGHILYGIKAVSLAKRIDNDDVLFFLPNNKYLFAVVHLTWSKESNSSEFPQTVLYSSLKEWVNKCMKVDNENYL